MVTRLLRVHCELVEQEKPSVPILSTYRRPPINVNVKEAADEEYPPRDATRAQCTHAQIVTNFRLQTDKRTNGQTPNTQSDVNRLLIVPYADSRSNRYACPLSSFHHRDPKNTIRESRSYRRLQDGGFDQSPPGMVGTKGLRRPGTAKGRIPKDPWNFLEPCRLVQLRG